MSVTEWITEARLRLLSPRRVGKTYIANVALDALEAVLAFATAERDKISRTYITQPDTAYAGYANAMDDVIRTIESVLVSERREQR